MAISLDPHLLADLSAGSGEPSGGSIWRDPHIQRQLQAVHLDNSTAAATRSPQAVRRTIDLLTAGLAPGAAVLDLGCGPGLYAQQLADDGFDVTGVDFNGASIQYARQHARGRLQYVEADYTSDLPVGPFDRPDSAPGSAGIGPALADAPEVPCEDSTRSSIVAAVNSVAGRVPAASGPAHGATCGRSFSSSSAVST